MPRKDKIKKGLKEKSGAELFLQKDEYTEKQEAANDFVLNAVDYLRNLENADDAFKEIKNLNDDEPVKGTNEFKEFFKSLEAARKIQFDYEKRELQDEAATPASLLNAFRDVNKKAENLHDLLEYELDNDYILKEQDGFEVVSERDTKPLAEVLNVISNYFTNDKEGEKQIQAMRNAAKKIGSSKSPAIIQQETAEMTECIDEVINERGYTREQFDDAKRTVDFKKENETLRKTIVTAKESQAKVFNGSKQFENAEKSADEYFKMIEELERLKMKEGATPEERDEAAELTWKLAEKLVKKADETRELIGKYFKRKEGQWRHNKTDKARMKIMSDVLESIDKLDKLVKEEYPALGNDAFEAEAGTVEFAQECIASMKPSIDSRYKSEAANDRKAIEMHMADIIAINLCQKDNIDVSTPEGKKKVSSVSTYVRSQQTYREMLSKANTPEAFSKLVDKALTKNGSELMVAYSKEFEASAQKGNENKKDTPVRNRSMTANSVSNKNNGTITRSNTISAKKLK